MKDVKYMTSLTAERLAAYCREVHDGSWRDAAVGARIHNERAARIFVRNGGYIKMDPSARITFSGGALFVLGEFTMMPRSNVELHSGMLVLGDGYLGFGSAMSCDIKLWLAEADIAPFCYIADTDGHHIQYSDGTYAQKYLPTIIHEHVFVGPGSTVLKGSDIGAGSVVGPKSMVRGEIPPACYAEGVPAVPVEHGIVWDRKPFGQEVMP